MTQAFCVLQRGKIVNQWLILDCPYCHKQHYHGGGKPTDDPRSYLGHRSAHCVGISATDGYVLVEADVLAPAEFLA